MKLHTLFYTGTYAVYSFWLYESYASSAILIMIVIKLLFFIIIASKAPGVVRVLLRQADGTELGETEIEYYNERKEVLQRITNDPMLQADFFQYHSEKLRDRNTTTANSAEAQNSGICGEWRIIRCI